MTAPKCNKGMQTVQNVQNHDLQHFRHQTSTPTQPQQQKGCRLSEMWINTTDISHTNQSALLPRVDNDAAHADRHTGRVAGADQGGQGHSPRQTCGLVCHDLQPFECRVVPPACQGGERTVNHVWVVAAHQPPGLHVAEGRGGDVEKQVLACRCR